jgi:uncharacterized integral membrane protein
MRKLLTFIFLAPVVLLVLAFTMANRKPVPVSFDPFNNGDIPSIETPLFLLLIFAAMCGLLLGWISTWLRHGHVRKGLRGAKAEAERLRAENEALRSQVSALKSGGAPKATSTALVTAR